MKELIVKCLLGIDQLHVIIVINIVFNVAFFELLQGWR